jgi:hypothetical protein
MKTANWLLLAGAAIGLVVLVLLARHKQGVLERGLPLRIYCADKLDALTRAGAGAIPISGTGSLAPYIPAAPAGSNPVETIVAFAIIDPAATYHEIKAGTLCIYSADWTKYRVIHQASARDSLGWIGSGLHNARSESNARITAQNFIGIVARVYVWPL